MDEGGGTLLDITLENSFLGFKTTLASTSSHFIQTFTEIGSLLGLLGKLFYLMSNVYF